LTHARIKIPIARTGLRQLVVMLRARTITHAEAAEWIESLLPYLHRERHPLARHPPRVHPPMTPAKAVRARQLKRCGLTNTEIAAQLDCNEGRVSEAIHHLR
jgi:hypothetical protein